jgi:beta-lactamase regulating signal transducer with metallopeptidase domain
MRALLSLDLAALAAVALNLLLPLTVVCLLALIAARGIFRRDPSARYVVCLAGLVCILLSPLVVCILHKMGYSLLTLSLPQNFALSPAPEAGLPASLAAEIGTRASTDETSLPPSWLFWGIGVLLSVWLVGVTWGAVRFARGWKEVARLTRGIRPWKAPAHTQTLEQLQSVLGRPLPPVFTSARVVSPVAVGLFRPAVILPEGLTERLSPVQLRQVLLHESAHVAFRHTFGGVIERIVRLLLWPHPLVLALCRELARAREEVCDNVASQEDGAACYARTLLAMAQGHFAAPQVTSALALLGPGTSLEERITGLLDPRRNRMVGLKRGKLWAVTGAAVIALGSTALVRVVAAEKEDVRAGSVSVTTSGPGTVSAAPVKAKHPGISAPATVTRSVAAKPTPKNAKQAAARAKAVRTITVGGKAKARTVQAEDPEGDVQEHEIYTEVEPNMHVETDPETGDPVLHVEVEGVPLPDGGQNLLVTQKAQSPVKRAKGSVLSAKASPAEVRTVARKASAKRDTERSVVRSRALGVESSGRVTERVRSRVLGVEAAGAVRSRKEEKGRDVNRAVIPPSPVQSQSKDG